MNSKKLTDDYIRSAAYNGINDEVNLSLHNKTQPIGIYNVTNIVEKEVRQITFDWRFNE